MTIPNGAAGINTTDGLFLVSAHGHGDLSPADLVGQDESTVRALLGQKYVTNGTSVLSSPTSPLAQVFGGFAGIPGMLAAMFGRFLGVDLSHITSIPSLLGAIQQVPVVGDFFALLNSFWSGLTGSPTGTQQTPATVGGAVAAQTAALASMAAKINALTQENIAQASGAALAIDDFARTGIDLGTNWDVSIVNDLFTNGYVRTDGKQALPAQSGFGNTDVIARYQGTNHTAATNVTKTSIVLGSPLSDGLLAPAAVDIHDRMSTDKQNSIRARLLTQGPSTTLTVHSIVAGVPEIIGTPVAISPQPAAGATPELFCGTDVSARQFLVKLGGHSYPFTEVGTRSQMGVGFRERGVGWHFGGSFFGQSRPGAVEHWTSIDIGVPTPPLDDGSGTGGGGTTADIIRGGSATSVPADVISGGSATSVPTDIISGGSA